jgi:hypothetical protein
MTDDHGEERPAYDPLSPTPPDRKPPLRSTAPQSDYTMGQVGLGFAVLLVGVALTFGLAILLA